MNNEGYITIQGWMRNELGLSGNELLAYALIYGFNQDGESTFRGSLGYVAEWLGCSKPTAISTLKKLVEKGLIERIEEPINGILFVRYRILTGSQNSLLGGSKNLTTPSKNSLPNNTSTDNQEDKKEKKEKENVIEEAIDSYTDNEQLRGAILEFVEYRKTSRNKMSILAVRKLLNTLKGFTVEEQIEAINVSIMSNWTGVFPRHRNGQPAQKGVGKVAHKSEEYDDDFDENGDFRWEKYGL